MAKTFCFNKQLGIGKAGETLFLKHHPDLTQTDGRKGDFLVGKTGRKIELKTESRPSTSPNMFIERWSDWDAKKHGGPWQAQEHGAHYLVQMFGDGVCLWFPVKELVQFMDKNEGKWKLHLIGNKGWRGGGFAVPQTELKHLVELREEIK